MDNLCAKDLKPEVVNEILKKRKKLISQKDNFKLSKEKKYPLSSAQKGIWIYNSIYKTPKFTLSAFATIEGLLNIDYFTKSINYIIQRHDIFKIKFKRDSENLPYQTYEQNNEFKLNVLNSSDDIQIQEVINNYANYVWDIENEKCYRFVLIRKSEDKHIFLCSFHHIISDAETFELFIDEVFTLYSNYINGTHITDILKAESYFEYCDIKSKSNPNLNYWKNKLNEDSLNFLFEKKLNSQNDNLVESSISFELPSKYIEKLKILCAKNQVTLFTGVFSVFSLALFLMTGKKDIYITSTFSDRAIDQFSKCYGMFINNLLLKINISYNDDFSSILKKANNEILESYNNNFLAFDDLNRELNLGEKYKKLINNVVFTFIDKERKEKKIGDLHISELKYARKSEFNTLNIFIENIKGKYYCDINYLENYFNNQDINKLKDLFSDMIIKCVQNPYNLISSYIVVKDLQTDSTINNELENFYF